MRRPLLAAFCVVAFACDREGTSARVESDDAVDAVHNETQDERPPPRSLPIASAGWLDHEDSPITPWCGAVLVAPDVAVTAARCFAGYDPHWFSVGFGVVGSKTYAVDEVIVQEDVDDPSHALAALHLAEPVLGIEPVDLGVDVAAEPTTCDVMTVAHLHVLRGDDETARWIWSGCLDRGFVRATAGTPNCHGDMGSGAFASREDGGHLIGIAVDIGTAQDGLGCAREHKVGSVTENAAFFDQALELSQPAA